MAVPSPLSRLFFRQLLPGRDICLKVTATTHHAVFPVARQMGNYIYLVGDHKVGTCLVIDPCWDVNGILKIAKDSEMRIVGALLTHYHFDHTGGIFNGVKVDGVYDIMKQLDVPVFVNADDAEQVSSGNGIDASHLVLLRHCQLLTLDAKRPCVTSLDLHDTTSSVADHAASDEKTWDNDGAMHLRFVHTPGHTPGCQCILINGRDLIAGDTLFVGSCGRLDLPDSSRIKMWHSLRMLSSLIDATKVWPGHNYGGASTTVGAEKKNGFLQPIPLDKWMATM